MLRCKIRHVLLIFLLFAVKTDTKKLNPIDLRLQHHGRTANNTRDPVMRKACHLIYWNAAVVDCVINNDVITKRNDCLQHRCCWHAGRCFKKPVKCNVDLRKEKCLLQPSKPRDTPDFVSGFSANGSHCYTLHHAHDTKRKWFGFVPRLGFRISAPSEQGGVCTMEWTYTVKTDGNRPDACTIDVHSSSFPLPSLDFRGTREGRRFNDLCVSPVNNFRFRGPDGVRVTECVCRIDAWLESDQEELKISSGIYDYLSTASNGGGDKWMLNNFKQKSWKERVEIVNKEEMDQVVGALKNITEKSDKLHLYDAYVLLENMKKVSNYEFDKSLHKTDVGKLIEDTVSITSNLLKKAIEIEGKEKNQAEIPNKSEAQHRIAKRDLGTQHNSNNLFIDPYDVKIQLFKTFENITNKVAMTLDRETTKAGFESKVKHKGIDFQLRVVESSNRDLLLQNSSQHESFHRVEHQLDTAKILDIPRQHDGSETAESRIASMTVFYRDPPRKLDADTSRASDYVSINVVQSTTSGRPRDVSVPVVFTLHHPPRRFTDVVCSFLLEDRKNEAWSDYGCSAVRSGETNTTCRCNHTTHFALLMKFTGATMGDERVLEVLSHTLGAVSSLFLLATLSVFIRYKKRLFKERRMLIHFHLILALLGGYLSITIASFSISTRPTEVTAMCILFAFLTHFFYLAVFFWSLVEGLYLVYKVTQVFASDRCLDLLIRLSPLLGWLLPFLIASGSLVATRVVEDFKESSPSNTSDSWRPDLTLVEDGYVNPKTCFLNVKTRMIYAFLGPVFIITLINLIIVAVVARIIYKKSSSNISIHRNNNSSTPALRKAVKGASWLMPILSVPWIIGLLYDLYEHHNKNGDVTAREVFGITGAYLQVIFAGVQGILIFFFYCFYNSEVQKAHHLSTRKRKSIASQGRSTPYTSSSTRRSHHYNGFNYRKFSALFTRKSVVRSESSKSTEMANLRVGSDGKIVEENRKAKKSSGISDRPKPGYVGRFPLMTSPDRNHCSSSGRYSSQETLVLDSCNATTTFSSLERAGDLRDPNTPV